MANTTWSTTDKSSNCTLSGGNLGASCSTVGYVRTAASQESGKYYYEITIATVGGGSTGWGLSNGAVTTPNGSSPIGLAVVYNTGNIWVNNVNTGSSIGAVASAAVVGIAVDVTARLIWFRLAPSGNWNGSGTANPATGVGGISITSILPPLGRVLPVFAAGTIASCTANFGDSGFSGAVPSGFTSGFSIPTGPVITYFSGVARESLVLSDLYVRLGGIAREALVGGDRVESWIRTKSSLQGQLVVTGGVVTKAAGAGGGGAAGFFGPGEFGQAGVYDGTGGYGGAGDDYHTERQLTPGSTGNAGNEWDGTYGSGSGGSGGSWGGTGRGGNGGRGGLYGGGGGGGGSGLSGGGLGALGGEGVIYLQYDPGTGPIVILLTKDSPTTFTIPANWNTTNNTVLIVGAGGCGSNGGLTTGGGGGGGGSVVGAINTSLYTPGQVIPITVPSAAQVCSGIGGNTVFGGHSAPPGSNGNGTGGGTPPVPIPPEYGGIGGGSGGSIGGGTGGSGSGGAGGGVTTLLTVRAETRSQLASGMLALDAGVRQYAVSVQTWHW
jgi:hypothetical protein